MIREFDQRLVSADLVAFDLGGSAHREYVCDLRRRALVLDELLILLDEAVDPWAWLSTRRAIYQLKDSFQPLHLLLGHLSVLLESLSKLLVGRVLAIFWRALTSLFSAS